MNGTTLAIILAVFASPGLGVVAAKFFRPNATPLELIQEIQQERDELKSDVRDLREEINRIRTDTAASIAALRAEVSHVRTEADGLRDYAHQLRGQVVDLHGTPLKWPEGMSA